MPKAGPKASIEFRSDAQAVISTVENRILVSQRLTAALSIGLFGMVFLVNYSSVETEEFKKIGAAKEQM